MIPVALNQEHALLFRESARLLGRPPSPFVLPVVFRLKGPLDVSAMQSALCCLAERHSALRVRFEAVPDLASSQRQRLDLFARTNWFEPGLYRQMVCKCSHLPMTYIDVSPLEEPSRDCYIRELFSRECEWPFHTGALPPIRASLLRVRTDEHLLLIFLDHIVGDAWSTKVIGRDLRAIYAGIRSGKDIALPPLASGFPDYAVWQHEMLKCHRFDDDVRFWQKRWADFVGDRIAPSDFGDVGVIRPAATVERSEMLLDPQISDNIRRLAGRSGITLHMFFLAVYCLILRLATGKSRLAVWGRFANRASRGSADLVGYFAHAHLLGVDLSSVMTMGQVLDQIKEQVISGCIHAEMPLPLLWYTLRCHPRFPDSHVLLDSFPVGSEDSWQAADGLVWETEGMTLPPVPEPSRFCVYVRYRAKQIQVACEVSLTQFPSSFGSRLLTEFRAMIEQVLAAPDSEISSYGLTSLHTPKAGQSAIPHQEMREVVLVDQSRLVRM